jgi:3-phytase
MKSRTEARAAATGLAVALVILATPLAADVPDLRVTATAETAPIDGDADDPAIWVNPADPAASRIIGTDKTAGLRVYDLSGALVQTLDDGDLNNVDVRPFPQAGDGMSLIGATRREDDTLRFYLIGPAGEVLRTAPGTHPGAPPVLAVDDIYGFALQRDPATGQVFALVNFKSGHVVQWRIRRDGVALALDLARVWTVPTQPEGIVSDDAAGMIYVGEEDAGIWRFPGDPAQPPRGDLVVPIPSPCLPRDDVEGLAIHDSPAGRFLIASAQGIHRAAIFDLNAALGPDGLPCRGLVEIAAGAVDGVTETDGLDVTAAALPGHPQGALVMMDDQNEGFSTNFKLIDWRQVAAGLGLTP